MAGNRVRDLRNGLSIPPELTLATIASVASKPSYWYQLLSGPPLDYANFAGRAHDDDSEDGRLLRRRPELVRHRGAARPLAGEAAAQGAGGAGRRAAGDGARAGRGAAVQPRRAAARPDRRPGRPDRAGPRGGRAVVHRAGRLGRPARRRRGGRARARGGRGRARARLPVRADGRRRGRRGPGPRPADRAVPVHDAVPRDDVGRGAAEARRRSAHARGRVGLGLLCGRAVARQEAAWGVACGVAEA